MTKIEAWFAFLESVGMVNEFMEDILNPNIRIASFEMEDKFKPITLNNYKECINYALERNWCPCNSLIYWMQSAHKWSEIENQWYVSDYYKVYVKETDKDTI